MIHHCPDCLTQWSAADLGKQCWSCGGDGAFGPILEWGWSGSRWQPCVENEGPSPI